MWTWNDTISLIKKHEGFRDRLYWDTNKVLTGGWGHAFTVGSFLPHDIAEKFFLYDFNQATIDYKQLSIATIDPVRRAVLTDMLFNLGLTKFLKFKRLNKALHEGDYILASKEMLDSKWAEQVGSRAYELSCMMERGNRSC